MTIPLLNSLSTQTGNDWVNITNDLVNQANAIGPYNAITLTGGTINGVVIGGTTAAAGKFTTLTVTSTIDMTAATVLLASGAISGNSITGGTITGVGVTLTADPTTNLQAATKQYVDSSITTFGATLSTVATSGSFNDLSNKPSIFKTITVATQTSIVAASVTDTLTVVAGANIALTTSGNNLTIALTSIVPVAKGGTNSSTATGALTNLGAAALSVAQIFTGGQATNATVVTSSSNITAINMNNNNDFTATLTQATKLANPSSMQIGQKGRIAFTQGSGGYALTYDTYYKFPNGVVPTNSTTNGALDILYYDVVSSTQIACNLVKAFA